tara:strand:+ start:7575 stop:7844 length:270 start_codon:yes stop_codon:yes gene_type:complete
MKSKRQCCASFCTRRSTCCGIHEFNCGCIVVTQDLPIHVVDRACAEFERLFREFALSLDAGEIPLPGDVHKLIVFHYFFELDDTTEPLD